MTRIIIHQNDRISLETSPSDLEKAWGMHTDELGIGKIGDCERIRLTSTPGGAGWQFEREFRGVWGAFDAHLLNDADIRAFGAVGVLAVEIRRQNGGAIEISKEHFEHFFEESDKVTTNAIAQDAISVYSNDYGVAMIDRMGHYWWPTDSAAIAEAEAWTDDDAVYGIIVLLSLGQDEGEVKAWAREKVGEEVAGWSAVTEWLQK